MCRCRVAVASRDAYSPLVKRGVIRFGVVFAMTVVIGCSGSDRRSGSSFGSRPESGATVSSTLSSATPSTPSANVAVGPAPIDLTWISDSHGWVLSLSDTCVQEPCIGVATTLDGGNSWTPVGAPHACVRGVNSAAVRRPGSVDTCSSPSVSTIRFANASEGFLFGPDLFVTHDGGNTWTQSDGPMVDALEVAGSTAVRVSHTRTGCPGACDWSVERAKVGTNDWQTLSVPAISQHVSARLVRQGAADIYAAFGGNPAGGAGTAQSDVLISHDGGDTWTSRSDPCGFTGTDENDLNGLAAAPNHVVAALCYPRLGQPTSVPFVVTSHDGGATFGAPQPLPTNASPALIAAASATDLVVSASRIVDSAVTEHSVLVSHDGGATWTTAANETGPTRVSIATQFLGFESATTARWIGSTPTIWTTTDAGDRWTAQTL